MVRMATPVVTAQRAQRRDLAQTALSVGVVISLSPYELHRWSARTNYFTATLLLPADVAFVIVLAFCAPSVIRGIRDHRIGPGAASWAAVAAALLLTFPWNPSGRGLLTIWHLGGCALLAAAATLALLSVGRARFATVVVGAGALEALLALLQMAHQGAIGLGSIVETEFPFFQFTNIRAPSATFPHPYLAAGFAVVSAGVAVVMALTGDELSSPRWAAAAGWCIVPVGLSYSRSAALGLAGFGVCLVWIAVRQPLLRRRAIAATLALAVGAAVPAAIWNTQWLARESSTISGATSSGPTAGQAIGNGRLNDVHQALTLLGEHPVTGVGAGLYIVAVEHHYHGTDEPEFGYVNANDMPLLAGAEGGVLALVVMAAALLWLGWRAWRTGPLALGLFIAFVPYCLLDQFPYESAQGAAICAVWLAAVDALVVRGRSDVDMAKE
jgi:O-antigen ligase/polysaccharide polymerase Wzy-like membrane protein